MVLLCGCRAVDRYGDYNAAYFQAVLDTSHTGNAQATFLRFVEGQLGGYNGRLAGRGEEQIRADCPKDSLIEMVHRDREYRARTALLLLSLRRSEDSISVVKTIANNRSTPGFTRLFAALVLAYWGDGECKEYLHEVIRHGLQSSSGFEYSYAGLGLLMLGDLPPDFRFRNVPNPMFLHLDDQTEPIQPAPSASPFIR
jgi:hypothetical protein